MKAWPSWLISTVDGPRPAAVRSRRRLGTASGSPAGRRPRNPRPSRTRSPRGPPTGRGLIPLHPLSFGQLLGTAFGVIRYNPRATVAPALIVSVIQSGLTFGLAYLVAISAFDRVERAVTDSDRNAIIAGAVGTASLGGLLLLAVTVFGGSLLQGMLVTVVARGALGERPTAGEALRAAARRIWPLVGVSALLGALQIVAVLVLALLVVGIASAGTIGVVFAVLLAVVGGLGFVVAYAFLTVKLATVPSGIVLERLGVFASIRRSWLLTRGAFWRTFGLLALVVVMVYIATQVVSLPFSVLGGAAGGLLFPNAGGDTAGTFSALLLSALPAAVVALIVGGIGQIAQIAAVVLVYLDRRMRLEGLDLELQRYVESGGADPYESRG